MRYENRTEPRMAKPEPTVPQAVGYYWAKWCIPEDGTADEEHFVRTNKWEVVEVHACLGETSEDFRASVPGVERTQSIENFIWAKPIKPIAAPSERGGFF